MSNEGNVDSLITALGGTVSPELSSILHAPGEIPPFEATPPPFGGGGGLGLGLGIGSVPLSRKDEQAIVKEAAAPAAARGAPMPSASKKFGILAKLVPGGNRVRIKKRLDNGQLATINDFVIADIEQDGDVETFITRRLKPVHGGGDYSVYIIDDKSDDHFAGTVNLIVEPKQTGMPQESAIIGLLSQAQHDLKQALSRQVDPMEQFDKTRQIMERIGGESGGGKNDVLIAMMQMQSQAQAAAAQSQREMMTMMMGKNSAGPDPAVQALTALMERMDRRLEKLETTPPPMPPSMPSAPPGPSIVEIIGAITGVASTVVLPLIAQMKSEPAIKPMELVQLMQSTQQAAVAAAQADKVSTRELLDIVRGDKAREVTLEDEITRAMKMREFASSFAPQSSGPAGTSFWDALVALFSSNDFAAAIGGRIRDTGGAQGGARQIGSGSAQNGQVVDLARERARRADGGKEKEQIVMLPEGFDVLCKAINDATDDGGRVEHTVKALLALYGIDQWKPFVSSLLESTAKNDRETVLRGMGGWFKMLVDKGGALTREGAIATLKAFDENWDLIRMDLVSKSDLLGMPHLKQLAQEAPAPAPVAPQPAAPAPNAPAPAQEPQGDDAPSDIPDDMERELYAPTFSTAP